MMSIVRYAHGDASINVRAIRLVHSFSCSVTFSSSSSMMPP